MQLRLWASPKGKLKQVFWLLKIAQSVLTECRHSHENLEDRDTTIQLLSSHYQNKWACSRVSNLVSILCHTRRGSSTNKHPLLKPLPLKSTERSLITWLESNSSLSAAFQLTTKLLSLTHTRPLTQFISSPESQWCSQLSLVDLCRLRALPTTRITRTIRTLNRVKEVLICQVWCLSRPL